MRCMGLSSQKIIQSHAKWVGLLKRTTVLSPNSRTFVHSTKFVCNSVEVTPKVLHNPNPFNITFTGASDVIDTIDSLISLREKNNGKENEVKVLDSISAFAKGNRDSRKELLRLNIGERLAAYLVQYQSPFSRGVGFHSTAVILSTIAKLGEFSDSHSPEILEALYTTALKYGSDFRKDEVFFAACNMIDRLKTIRTHTHVENSPTMIAEIIQTLVKTKCNGVISGSFAKILVELLIPLSKTINDDYPIIVSTLIDCNPQVNFLQSENHLLDLICSETYSKSGKGMTDSRKCNDANVKLLNYMFKHDASGVMERIWKNDEYRMRVNAFWDCASHRDCMLQYATALTNSQRVDEQMIQALYKLIQHHNRNATLYDIVTKLCENQTACVLMTRLNFCETIAQNCLYETQYRAKDEVYISMNKAMLALGQRQYNREYFEACLKNNFIVVCGQKYLFKNLEDVQKAMTTVHLSQEEIE